jgi:hypothetical protein
MIYRHDDKADSLVHISLSFFSLAKVILVTKGISKSTFKSIVSPWDNPESVVEMVGSIKVDLLPILRRYVPWVSTIPLRQEIRWAPTLPGF